MRSSRFTLSSFNVPPTKTAQAGLLVRVYPEAEIGHVFSLNLAETSIGREQVDIELGDDYVAPRHATITWNGHAHVLSDLGSLHGTFVNEQRIGAQVLVSGDRVRIGNQHLKYLAPGIDAAKLREVYYQIHSTDGLTATHNSHYFLESFQRELHRSQRSTAPLAIMLFEIDDLRAIHRSHGLIAADQVLMEFTDRVQYIIRRGDLFARMCEDRFALLCAQTQLHDALSLAERIRLAVSARPVHSESQLIPVTVSIGVAEFSACRSQEPNAFHAESLSTVLLAEARQYLLKARQQGCNQVVSCAKLANGGAVGWA